jgi:hypothetical protein
VVEGGLRASFPGNGWRKNRWNMLKLPNKLLGHGVRWKLYLKKWCWKQQNYKTDISATMAINPIQWVWFSTGHNANHSVCYEHPNEPPGRVEHLCRWGITDQWIGPRKNGGFMWCHGISWNGIHILCVYSV